MTNIAKALENILNGSNNFCCLCFNICDVIDLVCINDEVSFRHTSDAENIAMSDLILAVLGSNVSKPKPYLNIGLSRDYYTKLS